MVRIRRAAAGVACAASATLTLLVAACGPPRTEEAATPLPTRQTTIDPVMKKLDGAQQEAERRRSEADKAGQ
jgi:hypothetical protein